MNKKAKNLELHCYAPGDGALAFTWQTPDGKATGDKVTIQDAKNYLEAHPQNGPREVRIIDGDVRAIIPITRIDSNTIKFKDNNRRYRYERAEHVLIARTEEGREVRSISVLSAIQFFLHHEGQ